MFGTVHSEHRSGNRKSFRRAARALSIAGALSLILGSAASAVSTSRVAPSKAGALTATQISTLKAALAAATRPSRFVAAGPAFSAKGEKGKVIFLLQDGAQNQFGESFASGIAAATKAAGMTLDIGNGNDVTSQDDQVIENAINEHVAAIILDASPAANYAAALTQAKAAKIPVIETFIGDPRLPNASEKALGVFADATYCYSCTGLLSAEYEILKTGGHVTSMVQQYPGLPSSTAVAAGWKKGLSEFCPKSCSESYDDVTIGASTVQEIQSGAQVAAQNPALNTIFPVYDYQMAYILPELSAANASSRIDLLSENADLAQMQEMKAGTSVKVDVGNPVAWDGWSAIDEALRAIKGLPPVTNEEVPVRLFDTANVGSIDLTLNPADWYGTATYGLDYEKLWGLR